jgi:protein-L-isoaspartate(D-aspartate) O-methyltransferase
MVSIMNEALELELGNKVLEIGTGCGWHASTIAEIIAPSNKSVKFWGHIYTIEIIPSLVNIAKKNIKKAGYENRVTVICKDGSDGYFKEAPFDRILIAAAAPYIPPPLKEQLKSDGIMILPIGEVGFYQTLKRLRKVGKEVIEENLGGVAFVPLIGKYGHKIN